MENLVVFAIYLIMICIIWIAFNNCDKQQSNKIKENERFSNYCGKCSGKTVGQCLQCANCGFSSKGGYGKCIDGDMYGPSNFDPNYVTARWTHNDSYWTHILNTNDVAIPTTSPYTNRYAYYKK